jgi:hypothetical protein
VIDFQEAPDGDHKNQPIIDAIDPDCTCCRSGGAVFSGPASISRWVRASTFLTHSNELMIRRRPEVAVQVNISTSSDQ